MSNLQRVNTYFVNDGDGHYDQSHYDTNAGDFYVADDVDTAMQAMIKEISGLMFGAPPTVQIRFILEVGKYFPDLAIELNGKMTSTIETEVLRKLL